MIPERARVVIVGGGVIGCSVAYHLAHMGWSDVVILLNDPEPLMFHAEIVHCNGDPVGYVRAASYGFTPGGAGLAMIEADAPITQAYLDTATWEVDVAGTRYEAQASIKPLYDPNMERIRS